MTTTTPIAHPTAIAHVRLTVTDIDRSKAFYTSLLGTGPAADFSAEIADPGVNDDPAKLYGGCVFPVGDALVGLRPVATSGDTFDADRVGLDHLSLRVGSPEDLDAISARLADAGIEHGDVIDLGDMGMKILSVQDPDDINIEFAAPTS